MKLGKILFRARRNGPQRGGTSHPVEGHRSVFTPLRQGGWFGHRAFLAEAKNTAKSRYARVSRVAETSALI